VRSAARVALIPRIRAASGVFPTVCRVPHDTAYPISRDLPGRRSAGFSFLEMAVTLALLAILAAVGYTGFSAVRSNTEGAAAGPLLSVAQLEARRLSAPDGGFPADAAGSLVALSASGLTFTQAASTDTETVSVYRIDEESLVLATVSGDDCLVLLDRPFGSSTWAVFRGEADDCVAGELAGAAAALTPGGSSSVPQEVGGG